MKAKNTTIFNSVVEQDLCVGCGACTYKFNSNEVVMDWNKEGFLVPKLKSTSIENSEPALNACPFNPFSSDEVRTEDELSNIFLKDAPSSHFKVGRYFNTYVGYSERFRLTSSSGGLATYILNELFDQKVVDAVISVGEGINSHYEYKLIKRKEDLLATSKTKYYPVTMSDVLKELKSFDGKVAVVGVGCFIKAIRLLQFYNPELKEKIVFTIGIICGGLKSRFFAEFLAEKAGSNRKEYLNPQFRIKDLESTASDYSFGCNNVQGQEKQIKMRTVGDMWGSGMFKNNACDFCDDVTSELSDISLGDAWIPSYIHDGKGTNVIVTRSSLAEKLIKDGMKAKSLNVEELSFNSFLQSQRGSFNHRHKGLKYRIQLFKNKISIPTKRHAVKNISFDFKWVQQQRRKIRKYSLEYWAKSKGIVHFDEEMKRHLRKLRYLTKIYHYKQVLLNKIGYK